MHFRSSAPGPFFPRPDVPACSPPSPSPHPQASTIKAVMASPLPRRYEETAAAAGGAASGDSVGGDSFSGDAVTRAMQARLGGVGRPAATRATRSARRVPQLAGWLAGCVAVAPDQALHCFATRVPAPALQAAQHKVEHEVLAPLHRWQEVFTQLGVRAALPPGLRGPLRLRGPLARPAGLWQCMQQSGGPQAGGPRANCAAAEASRGAMPAPSHAMRHTAASPRALGAPHLAPAQHGVRCLLQSRFKELEAVRLEVDSRRRTVADLAQK